MRYEIYQGEAIPVYAQLAYADGTLVLSSNTSSATVKGVNPLDDTVAVTSVSVTSFLEASQQTITLPDTGTGAQVVPYTFSHEYREQEFLAYTGDKLIVEYTFNRTSTSEKVQLRLFVTFSPKHVTFPLVDFTS